MFVSILVVMRTRAAVFFMDKWSFHHVSIEICFETFRVTKLVMYFVVRVRSRSRQCFLFQQVIILLSATLFVISIDPRDFIFPLWWVISRPFLLLLFFIYCIQKVCFIRFWVDKTLGCSFNIARTWVCIRRWSRWGALFLCRL